MKRCSNGHYYDPKKNKYCPFCGIDINLNPQNNTSAKKKRGLFGRKKVTKHQDILAQSKTVLFEDKNNNQPKQNQINTPQVEQKSEPRYVKQQQPAYRPSYGDDEERTVLIRSSKQVADLPLPVGWLVQTIEESALDHPLRVGMNFVYIKEDLISVKYTRETDDYVAVIIYDPQNNSFHIKAQTQDIFVNSSVVNGHADMRGRTSISFSNAEMTFIPLCGEAFTW